jgi:hypothetical protein
MATTEYSGSDGALRIDGQVFNFSRLRVHIHGDAGDISVSEFAAKRRNGTLQDWELTITQPSFNPNQNPWNAPLNLDLFSYHDVQFFPGGIGTDFYDFTGGLIDDVIHDDDVNQEQPFEVHVVCGSGVPATTPVP